MSAGDDNVFSRWSRRKLAAGAVPAGKAPPPTQSRADAGPADAEPAKADPAEARPADAGPVEPPPPVAEPADGEAASLEALPRLEDLDAGSDLSAFLRKGVPAALKNRALRKMWSLDPEIRDYVGPAEYAWDFNTPGSMPGFGPLEPNSAVVDFLSKVGKSVPSDEVEPSTAPQPAAAQPDDDGFPSEGREEASESTAEAAAEDRPAATAVDHSHAEPRPEVAADAGATSVEEPALAESARKPGRPRHGGAMPR